MNEPEVSDPPGPDRDVNRPPRAPVFPRGPGHLLLVVSLLIAAVVLLAVGYGLVEARRLTVVRYDVPSRDLPPAFDGLQVALLSDIHRGPFLSQERLTSLVEKVKALSPDLIILGGDNVYRMEERSGEAYRALSGLRAPLGVYGVMGNHDHYNGEARARAGMAEAGITDLDNHAVWLERQGERIKLGGVDDLAEGDPNLSPTVEGSRAEDFVLLVSHEPDIVPKLPAGVIDLVLSGHLHGGQITAFGWAPFLPSAYGQRFRTGLVEGMPAPAVVSNGIGTIIVPLRLFAPPQLVIVRLHREG